MPADAIIIKEVETDIVVIDGEEIVVTEEQVEFVEVAMQGPEGIPGPSGVDGDDGLSAYQIAVAGGFVGDEAAWLLSLKGETGEQGPIGNEGIDYDHIDYTVNGNGYYDSLTYTLGGLIVKQTTITYNADNTVNTITETTIDTVTVFTYTYDVDGNLTDIDKVVS